MNSNTRTGNWSAFGSGGRSGGFGRQTTNDTSAFGGGGGRDSAAWGAFGSQRDERAEQRKREREAEAAREAAAARAKKAAEEAEAKKLADAQNFTSQESYPALGGGGPAKASTPKMNWGAAAKLGVARAVEREAEERAASAIDRGSRFDTIYTTRARPPPAAQRAASTVYEDEEEPDYEEDTYAPRERERQRMAYAGDDGEEDEDGEFNADIVSGRRRGDKGIW